MLWYKVIANFILRWSSKLYQWLPDKVITIRVLARPLKDLIWNDLVDQTLNNKAIIDRTLVCCGLVNHGLLALEGVITNWWLIRASEITLLWGGTADTVSAEVSSTAETGTAEVSSTADTVVRPSDRIMKFCLIIDCSMMRLSQIRMSKQVNSIRNWINLDQGTRYRQPNPNQHK